MTKLRISVPGKRFETTTTLLEDEAPKTCRAITNGLPIQAKLLHAAMSGQVAALEMRGKRIVRIEPENSVYSTVPGDLLYWYSYWGDGERLKDLGEYSEIIFVYGRHTRLRDMTMRDVSASLFATIDGKLDLFARICKDVHDRGPVSIKMERL